MDFQSLEVLEQKIKRLVSTLQALQSENEQLTRKCTDGEKTLHKLQQDLDDGLRRRKKTTPCTRKSRA